MNRNVETQTFGYVFFLCFWNLRFVLVTSKQYFLILVKN